MAKFVTPIAMSLIQQATGSEPFVVVQVNWGAGLSYYSTREANGMNANIMEIGSIRNERRADSMCNVGSVRLKLSDTDGAMRFVLDRIQAENAPAAVYLVFEGTSQADWIELIHGRTVGPISWDEGTRTVELDIETFVQSREIGYSANPGDFFDLAPTAIGVPWPMIFGKCCHVPALLVRRHSSTHLQVEITLKADPILTVVNNGKDIVMVGNPQEYCYLESDLSWVPQPTLNTLFVEDASDFPQGTTISLLINNVVFVGQFINNHEFKINESNAPKYKDLKVGARPKNFEFDNPNVLCLADSTISLANHHCYFVKAGGLEWYNYCVQQIGIVCYFRFPFTDINEKPILMGPGRIISEVYGISKCGLKDDIASDINFMKDACQFRKKNAGANNFGALMARAAEIIKKGSAFWSASMDDEVRAWTPNGDPDIYVASLTPLTEVKAVWGKRRIQVNGKSKTILAQIPTNYYDVVHGKYNINGQKATAILFQKPLGDYPDQNWQEDVFVTATGSIGPNPVDIIQWLITNYTDLFCDASMFQIARGSVNAKANFALFEKRDALKICQEIAFQSKCALLLDQGGIGIVFLASEPTQQWNFDESSTKNLRLTYTERKDIITKYLATYTTTYKDKHHIASSSQMNTKELERVLRSILPTQVRSRSETTMYVYLNHVNKYGLSAKEEAFYIFNDYAPVKDAANFWGFRFSNSWKLVEFETWLQGVRLQPFDGGCIGLYGSISN